MTGRQRALFDVAEQTKWYLRGRMCHVVARTDGTGYTLRVRWSPKLGLQLDHVFVTSSDAHIKARDIERNGFLRPVFWKKIFRPQWDRSCHTQYSEVRHG